MIDVYIYTVNTIFSYNVLGIVQIVFSPPQVLTLKFAWKSDDVYKEKLYEID